MNGSSFPKQVRGLGGPITVRWEKESQMPGIFGQANWGHRLVRLCPTLRASDAAARAVLYHELMHFALNDSGQKHQYTEAQQEAICDLVGSMMAALGPNPP